MVGVGKRRRAINSVPGLQPGALQRYAMRIPVPEAPPLPVAESLRAIDESPEFQRELGNTRAIHSIQDSVFPWVFVLLDSWIPKDKLIGPDRPDKM